MKIFARQNPACRVTQHLSSRLLDGAVLSAKEEKQRSVHLLVCTACQKMQADLGTQSELLSDMLRGDAALVSIPPAASGTIAARAVSVWLAEQEASPANLLPLLRTRKRFALGFAASLVIAGAGIGIQLAKNEPNEPVKTAKHDAAPWEQRAAHAQTKLHLPPIVQAGTVRIPPIQNIPMLPAVGGLRVIAAKNGAHISAVPVRLLPTAKPGDDLVYLNGTPKESAAFAGRWLNLTANENEQLQADVEKTIQTGDLFVEVPFPRVASTGGMDAVNAAAITAYRQEREIVDARLQRKVTLGMKRVSFADFCVHLQTETGISFAANKVVADDKMTIFCTDRPLRDVMREVAALFNFSWQRSGEEGAYQYRLTQPLRSQLVEEELRNHDRNEALIALDKEMEKYKSLVGLSPSEAKERAANATGDEKKLYENLAGAGWGPAQLYAGLGQDQLAALRDGQVLDFSAGAGNTDGALNQSVASGILQSLGDTTRLFSGPNGDRVQIGPTASRIPGGVPPASVPNAMATSRLELVANELGEFALRGSSGFTVQRDKNAMSSLSRTDMAVGHSPSSQNPKNAEANVLLKAKEELQKPFHFPARDKTAKTTPSKITTADILEALHKATGRDVIGDYYTRLFDGDILAETPPRPLFALLCDVSDKARLRWGSEESWLTFRSASFFNDRPKEVPNRFLERWESAQQANQKVLPFESLLEIAQMSDVQLSASSMAEGAKLLYGLQEWDLARNATLRESWRLLASLPRNSQKAALKGTPIRFDQLGPAQQERFAAQALDKSDLASAALGHISGTPSPAEQLGGATLGVDYQAPDASHPDTKISFTYRYGTENAPITKILKPNSTSVSRSEERPAPKTK